MKKLLFSCILLASCLVFFSCSPKETPAPSSDASSSGTPSSSISSEQASRDAWKAPSTVGYTYIWDDTLQNIYAPSEAYPMGDPQPGGEPIHINPSFEQVNRMDVIWFGGDIIGDRVAYIQAVKHEYWDDPDFYFSSSFLIGPYKIKTYTREELAPYLIREDEDYVLLDITELVLGSSFEESLKQKAAERNTPEVMYSWVLEPAAHLKEHLSEIIVKG